jgi:hypothetical protein
VALDDDSEEVDYSILNSTFVVHWVWLYQAVQEISFFEDKFC